MFIHKDILPPQFDFNDEEETHKRLVNEFEGMNTRCKLLYHVSTNTYFMYLPYKIFPDFKNIQQSQPIYFLHKEGRIYITLTEPKTGVYYKTRAQKTNMKTTPRCKITFPKKSREALQLQQHDLIDLIQQGDVYLCSVAFRHTKPYE